MAASKSELGNHRYYLRQSRFTKKTGWCIYDLSIRSSGNIAVSGGNKETKQTFIDVYVGKNCNTSNKPDILYSKEFEKYSSKNMEYWGRKVSFTEHSHDIIVTCLGNKLEVINVRKDMVLKSCKVKRWATCVSVREMELFVTFNDSNKINVYDVMNLHKIKSFRLEGDQLGTCFKGMSVCTDNVFACVGNGTVNMGQRAIQIEEKNGLGRVLSEYTRPPGQRPYAMNITVNELLGVVAVLWSLGSQMNQRLIEFYPVISEPYTSFLSVEVEADVNIVKLSDRGDRMVTSNGFKGEVKVYDMMLAGLFTYDHLKDALSSRLQKYDCLRLAKQFTLSGNQEQDIASSYLPARRLFVALEGSGVMQSFNVDKLIDAFLKFETNSYCLNAAAIYQGTRTPSVYKDYMKKLREDKKNKEITSQRELTQMVEDHKRKMEIFQRQAQTLKEATKVNDLARQQTQRSHEVLFDNLKEIEKVRDEMETLLDLDRLTLSSLQEELENTKDELVRVKELFNHVEQEQNRIKQCRQQHFPESMEQAEASWQARPSETQQREQQFIPFDSSPNLLPGNTRYLHESLVEAEFGKLVVDVSQHLTLDNCVFLATLFRFPAAIVDFLRHASRSDIPGIRLFDKLQERQIINKYDISNLRKGLRLLQLVNVIDTLVIPYQRKIDPRLRDQHKLPTLLP